MMTKRFCGGVAALAIAGLALTGCGGADTDSTKQDEKAASQQAEPKSEVYVYDFEQAKALTSDAETPYVVPNAPFTVTLSDELSAVIPEGAGVAVETFDVTVKAFSTGVCRLDAEITYAEGGLEALKAEPAGADPYGPTSEAVRVARAIGIGSEATTVGTVPGDDAIEEGAEYLTEDFAVATVVRECSEDTEDDEFLTLRFPYLEPTPDGVSDFATADVFVVTGGGQDGSTDGATAVVRGGTDAEVSPNGSWRQPD